MSRSDARFMLVHRDMEAMEQQVKGQLELLRIQADETSRKKDELATDSDSDEDSDAELVSAEIQKQSNILDEGQVSLGVIFAQLRAGRTHQEIGNVLTDDESRALVGMSEELVGKMDQRIGNVTTTKKSSAMVGVFRKDVNLGDFFSRPRESSG